MSAEFWLALAGLAMSVLTVISAGIWQLSRTEARLQKHLALTESRLQEALTAHRAAVQQVMDGDRRATSEGIQAVRQKINDVELEAYKTFVRRDSFHEIINRVSAENSSFKEMIGERLDRQEAKIDKLIERAIGRDT